MHIIDATDFARMVFHVHSDDGPAGAFFEPEDAAMFVACLGEGSYITDPNGTVLWSEGEEDQSASDSYDQCADTVRERHARL